MKRHEASCRAERKDKDTLERFGKAARLGPQARVRVVPQAPCQGRWRRLLEAEKVRTKAWYGL